MQDPQENITISIIADSLAMPRIVDGEEVFYSESWPVLLQEMFHSANKKSVVANFSERKRSSVSLKNDSLFMEAVTFTKPDVIILQIGVVDAAPRIFSTREQAMLSSKLFPAKLRKRIIKDRKTKRNELQAKDPLKKVYTKLEDFEKYVQGFLDRLDERGSSYRVLILPILGDIEKMDSKSLGFGSNVLKYNEILDSLSDGLSNVEFLSSLQLVEGDYFKDHYHLSKSGHLKIASFLSNTIIQKL